MLLPYPGVRRHQLGASPDCSGPSREFVEELERRILGDSIEVMIAVNDSAQSLHNNLEKGSESFICSVFRF
jgi:hypothetical protein